MLSIDPESAPLSAAQRYALDVLLDLSRVVRVAESEARVPASLRIGVRAVRSANTGLGAWAAGAWGITAHRRPSPHVQVTTAALDHVARLVGAVDEQHSAARDRFGRVPSTANALVAAGMERLPVVHLAADELRRATVGAGDARAVRVLSPFPDRARWAVAVTHDIDVVAHWPVFTALRLAELARKMEIGRVSAVFGSAARAVVADPVTDAVRDILATERIHGVPSTWFALCGTPTAATMRAGDLTYLPESRAARRIFDAVHRDGHEIGLHGSFATYENADELRSQRARLGRLIGVEISGVRQHYVRMVPGSTQRAMTSAGFRYDATFGFPDRNGFRLGVADVMPAWSAADGQQLSLDEVPFVWMDRALSKYAGVENPARWIDDALALARVCRDHAGVWCGIWHPNLTDALGFPGAPAAYRSLLSALAADAPWFATVKDVVDWRALRRAVRAVAVNDNGTVVLSRTACMEQRFTAAVALKDGRGARVPHAWSA